MFVQDNSWPMLRHPVVRNNCAAKVQYLIYNTCRQWLFFAPYTMPVCKTTAVCGYAGLYLQNKPCPCAAMPNRWGSMTELHVQHTCTPCAVMLHKHHPDIPAMQPAAGAYTQARQGNEQKQERRKKNIFLAAYIFNNLLYLCKTDWTLLSGGFYKLPPQQNVNLTWVTSCHLLLACGFTVPVHAVMQFAAHHCLPSLHSKRTAKADEANL